MDDDMPILRRREIEASIIKPIYKEMVEAFGEETARVVLSRAIRRDAVMQGKACAETKEGKNNIDGFVQLFKMWTADDALTVDVLEQTDHNLDFNVTKCRYAEMYRKMGSAELGDILSCGRDGHFCKGYNPRLNLERNQTIMGGASHCDFRYRLMEGDEINVEQ